jgi:bifunctional DNA-binding transcriptional regulator/antitoxin component of YhaV-PrlF toxin-antitoxin module
MSNKIVHFKEIIKKMPPNSLGSWHYVDFPENAFDIFGKRGYIRIKGLINNRPFKSNLFPTGNGHHIITIPLKLQKQLGIKLHQEIELSVEEDFEEIIVEMPVELQEALDFDEEMAELFNKLSPANQKYQKKWINSGKHIETRINRVVKIFERLRTGKNIF